MSARGTADELVYDEYFSTIFFEKQELIEELDPIVAELKCIDISEDSEIGAMLVMMKNGYIREIIETYDDQDLTRAEQMIDEAYDTIEDFLSKVSTICFETT